MREAISVTLESKLIKRIDDSKHKNEPRSRFIEDVISNYLESKGGN